MGGRLALAWCLLLPGLLPAAPSGPSRADVQRLYDARKYRETLAAIAQVLTVADKDAKSAGVYALKMIKGECLLQLKEPEIARAAFADAADDATAPKDAALAEATALLVSRSPTGAYVPRHPADKKPARPLDVLDPAGRKPAFAALLNDELVALQPQFKAAMAAKTLPELSETMTLVFKVNAVEQAANGSDARTGRMTAEIKDRAQTLMTDAMKRDDRTVDRISQAANQWVREEEDPKKGRDRNVVVYIKRGLNAAQRADLKDIADTCDKIAATTRNLAREVGQRNAAGLDDVTAESARVKKSAESVLHADYNGIRRDRR